MRYLWGRNAQDQLLTFFWVLRYHKGVMRNRKMCFHSLLLLSLCCATRAVAQKVSNVTITVRGSIAEAETDETFVCATLDWWPPTKCNYNQCPWGESSILNLDIKHPLLANAIQAFNPLRIRIGGSLQDQVVYEVSAYEHECVPFEKMIGGLFGFSNGCLSRTRWDELNYLFQKTGAVITFGLNALFGRHQIIKDIWEGSWNSSNARDFIEYTVSKGYNVDSWEFGNELSGHGIGARVDAYQYGEDVVNLKALLNELYMYSTSHPLLLAPGGFFDEQWYSQFLQVSGPGVVDGLTHHIYNLGGGNDTLLSMKILDPHYLSGVSDTYRDLERTIQTCGAWASSWVGEAGGAYNSGGLNVSHAFINSFWYLDQLGMASKYNTKVFCRQTLVGGHYGLLDTQTFVPNPDYYSALLWHRIMGTTVLSIDMRASPHLRAYAHCSRKHEGISLLLINLSNTTRLNLDVRNDINANPGIKEASRTKEVPFFRNLKNMVSWIGSKADDSSCQRFEYHLTAKDDDLHGRTMLLNGLPLELTINGDIPSLEPAIVSVETPVVLAPLSLAFVVLPNFEAQACV